MTTIALRKYNELINSLIDQEKYPEAISHCTTILNSYPKSIDTYQCLGRALLESKQFEEAENVFSKVLSVFPEDFSAHASLSEINEEKRELDTAIWHMERAFETQPSNLNVQEEMRRLIGRRDGTPPAKVRLTRGALIRMYAKGDLYQQAIAETQSAVEADPDRMDLKVLLARFYHATGANAEAASTCAEILSSSPYCYEANRIMFDISSHSNEFKYDPIYHERLSELDPYYRFVEDSKVDVKSISDEKVILDTKDFIPDQPDAANQLDWAQKIGGSWQEVLEDTTEDNVSVDSFRDNAISDTEFSLDTPQVIPFLDDFTEETAESINASSELKEDSIPDWIAKAGWIRATDEEVPPTPIDTVSSDLGPESGVQPAERANDLPDWLKTLNPETIESPEVLTPTGEVADLESEIPPLTPELLSELLADENQTDSVSLSTSVDEVAATPEVIDIEATATKQDESLLDETIPDLPDWLKDLDTGEIDASEGISSTAEGVSSPELEARSEMPDFIDELSSTDLLSPEDLLAEAEETLEPSPPTEMLEVGMVEPETPDPELEMVESQPMVLESTEKTETKPTVPSWVSRILTSSASAAPVLSKTPPTPEAIPVAPINAEAAIPEFIHDLPDIESGEGAISTEETRNLETWLSEINPEETLPIELQAEAEETLPLEPQAETEETLPIEPQAEAKETLPVDASSPLISFDTLVEPLITEEPLEIETEMITEPVDLEEELADNSNLQDRLSSMLGIEETLEIPASTEEAVLIPQETTAGIDLKEKLTQFLHSADYSSFLNTINIEELPVETADDVIVEINEELKSKPGTFELWQSLGDIQSKKDNLNEALSAYKEAEKHLFQ